jgi:DNA-binding response OmpR family regulator
MSHGQEPPEKNGAPSADEQALLYARDLARAQTIGPLRRRLAGQAGKVLLVDDEDALRLLVSTTLANQNFEILEAARGDVALKVIWEQHPRLVLLDIRLPDMSGLDICRRIKTDPLVSDIKVVMLTGVADDEERRAAMDAGAERYLTKPFSPLNLMETVTNLLEPPREPPPSDSGEFSTQTEES